jgi:hypothetical protein
MKEFSIHAKDAYRFVLAFYDAITESTPHLYVSALPFAPKDSEVGRYMLPFSPNTLSIIQGADGNVEPLPPKHIPS